MDIRKLVGVVSEYWQSMLMAGILIIALCGFLWFRLGSLQPDISAAETHTIAPFTLLNQADITSIFVDPINLPYRLVLYILNVFSALNVTVLRWLSTIIAATAAVSFYALLKRWHTSRVALLGSTMFVLSSWFLHTARTGHADVLYLLLLLFFFVAIWFQHSRRSNYLLSFLLIGACLLLYVPGLVWFVVLGGIWQRQRILSELKHVSAIALVTYALIGAFVSLPLLWATATDPATLKTVLGFPESLPSITGFLSNLVNIPNQLLVSGVNNPEEGLTGVAWLDIFSITMFIIGLYWYGKRFRLDRTAALLTILLFGSFLIALGGPVSTTLLLPFIYLIIAAGITYLLSEWFAVFPRNPIARMLGAALVASAVFMATFYHLNRYYIAWPNAPETKAVFQEQRRE